MDLVSAVWTPAAAADLRRARGRHGHSQSQCAERLRQLGLAGADQSSVTRWETGATTRPRATTIAVLQEYVREAAVGEIADAKAPGVEGDLDGILEDLTGEPFLGPRQAELVDVQLARLRAGEPFTPADVEIVRMLMVALRMPISEVS